MLARVRLLAAAMVVVAVPAWAQPLGQFSWQLQPYCNVVSASIVQNGGVYTLDGFDDQCGAAQRAPLTGLATPNPDGTIGFGLTIVSTPGGVPVHVAARITLAALSGSWNDSTGASGTFAFGARTGGSARPPATLPGAQIVPGSIGAAQVNTAQVQARITGLCPAGQFAIRVNADGSLVCDAPALAPGDFAGGIRSMYFGGQLIPATATSVASAYVYASPVFTAPQSGTMLLRARGYCRIDSLTTGPHGLFLGMYRPGETGIVFNDGAAIEVPQDSASGSHAIGFEAERLLSVTAGGTYPVDVRVYHTVGAAGLAFCRGTLAATLFTGTLP